MNNFSNVRILLNDEISLEGLDGITLQTLWIRISHTTNTNLPFPELLEKQYWNIIRKNPDYSFYELPEPRPDYIPFDRFMYMDCEVDVAYNEPEDIPDDIYAHKIVNDTLKGIKGSCANYFQRKDITEKARTTEYEEIKKWGNKFVIVASQELRDYALIGTQVSNCIELSPIQYCVLERIGRARFQGEITQGKRSLQIIGEDPKSLFYHRKTLLKYKLITKQVYYQKTGSQNFSGTLLHLQRFYMERKPKQLIITEQIVEYLKTKPNYTALYSDISAQITIYKPLNKLLKSSEFQRFVRTDVKVPYRQIYPECTNIKEWKYKNMDKEKVLRCVQLIDPEIDVADNWHKSEPDEEEVENESGYLDYSNLELNTPILFQVARIVRSKGDFGCCQSGIGNIMGVSKLGARAFCRNLVRRNVVTCVMNDVGRQRVTRFTSRKFEDKGIMTLQLKQEREKMLNLMSTTQTSISSSNNEEHFVTLDTVSHESNTSTSVETKDTTNDTTSVDDGIKKEIPDIPSSFNILNDPNVSPPKKQKLALVKRILEEPEEPPSAKKQKFESDIELQRTLDNIEVQLIVTKTIPGLKGYSKGFAEQMNSELSNPNIIDGSKMTYRLLRRANFIIEVVREVKVIADITKLMKTIQEDEMDEGYNVKIDKKSLLRLILKLAKEGYVKYIKANLTYNDKTKSISFICEPSIEENHTIIQSAIEQAKMKFNLSGKVVEHKAAKAIETEDFTYYYDRNMRKYYGYCPKFMRMRFMHELMFYLIYEEQSEPLTTPEEYKEWLEEMNIEYDDVLLSEMSPIYYKKELCWRTFLPAIPIHADWPKGWALICDILLRIPLQIFIQCFSVLYQIDNIEYYMNHPVRKNFLVKHLPAKIRNALIYKRRYIFQMHEICSKLCYCGLVQFGPHKLKEKDQVFVYLNRNSSILNTTTSAEGYHEISAKEYDKHNYYFENSTSVEQYWYDLYSTCINTRLGGRLCVNGKYIVLEQLETKEAMIESVQPRTAEEAAEKDNGDVPGNRRGAAGLDSALFAHLRRSWNWNCNDDICTLNSKTSSETVQVQSEQNLNEYFTKQLVLHGPAVKMLNKDKDMLIKKKVAVNSTEPGKKRVKMTRRTVVRKIGPKTGKIRKPFYDEIDKIALQKMGKLRTDWSPLEDHILLLCMIGSKYLCPNRHKQVISFAVIRDVLHKLVETSVSKTSRACQRRILYIMRNPNTRHSVQMCLEEIHQSENINKKYRHVCKRISNSNISELEYNIAFIELVSQMSTMFAKLIEPGKNIQIPSTMEKFHEKFRICGSLGKTSSVHKDPENTNDINIYVIRSVIHSSMCCLKDKTSWAYQLFKIYQQYPETLLRSVISKTRNEQMIAVKKAYMRMRKTKGGCIPLSSSPYKLSITYTYQLHTKYPYTIYTDAYNLLIESVNTLNKTEENSQVYEIINPLSGVPIVLMEMSSKMDIEFSFEIPDEIIVLDQNMQNDKYYDRIITKYYNFINDPNKAEMEEKNKALSQEEEQNFPYINEVKKTDLGLFPRNPSTRLALYMMRAEMIEGMDYETTQHMHDFFVVNSCRVFINFPHLKDKAISEPEDIHEDYSAIRNEIGAEVILEIKSNAIIPDKCPTEEEINNVLSKFNANEDDKNFVKELLTFISDNGVFGSTNKEIIDMLPENYQGNILLHNLLDILSSIKIIIRTGVEIIRYIHYEHKKPWIINSYKILRLDREKLPTVTSATKEKLSNKLHRKKANFTTKELEKSKERLDLTTQQQVKVLIYPWIRIDGTLNRRVLDRWLGSVLITCLQQPGITLFKLTQIYTFVTPVELSNLIRYLVKLQCLRQILIKKSKTTLFSTIPTATIVPATGLEDPKHIILEPYCDATIKFAIFIGKKTYSADFLCA